MSTPQERHIEGQVPGGEAASTADDPTAVDDNETPAESPSVEHIVQGRPPGAMFPSVTLYLIDNKKELPIGYWDFQTLTYSILYYMLKSEDMTKLIEGKLDGWGTILEMKGRSGIDCSIVLIPIDREWDQNIAIQFAKNRHTLFEVEYAMFGGFLGKWHPFAVRHHHEKDGFAPQVMCSTVFDVAVWLRLDVWGQVMLASTE